MVIEYVLTAAGFEDIKLLTAASPGSLASNASRCMEGMRSISRAHAIMTLD